MHGRAWKIVALWLCTGCGRLGFDGVADVMPDTSKSSTCTSWDAPRLVAGLENTIASGPTLTADLLSVYFDDDVSLYVSHRLSPTGAFDPPELLTLGTATNAGADPEISSDGSILAFVRDNDLYVASSGASRSSFAEPVKQTALGKLANPQLSGNGETLRFDVRPGTQTVRATRTQATDSWTVMSTLLELDPSGAVTLTADELEIVFERQIAPGDFRLFMATRENVADPFGTPVIIPELADFDCSEPWISPDGRTLFIAVDLPVVRLWTTTRTCD